MEKIKPVEETTIKTVHEFYCDLCGKFLGDSTEDDSDGYFDDIGQHSWEICMGDYLLKKEGHYCDDCWEKADVEIKDTLIKLGFEKERD